MKYPWYKHKERDLVLEQRVPYDSPTYNNTETFAFWVVESDRTYLLEGELYPFRITPEELEKKYDIIGTRKCNYTE